MSAENFDACLAEVLAHEGGYVNHKRDPGGETNMGISRRSYPHENIRGMTRARAAVIYRRDFWDRVRGDALPPGVDLVAFDAAVNSGVSRGARWIQAAVGVTQDGVIGFRTLAALAAYEPGNIINVACDRRMSFLRGLKTWGDFGKGWTRRVSSVRSTALRMAGGVIPAPPVDHVPVTPPPPVGFWAWLAAFLTRKD
jgi:lysozyme family protein